jgi:hypothetical protein
MNGTIITQLDKLFEKNNLEFYENLSNLRGSFKLTKMYEKKILHKYPSDFFDEWITTFGPVRLVYKCIRSYKVTHNVFFKYVLTYLLEKNIEHHTLLKIMAKCIKNNLHDISGIIILATNIPKNTSFIKNVDEHYKHIYLELGIDVNEKKQKIFNIDNYTIYDKMFCTLLAKSDGTILCDQYEKFNKTLQLYEMLKLTSSLMAECCKIQNIQHITFLLKQNVKLTSHHMLTFFGIAKRSAKPKKEKLFTFRWIGRHNSNKNKFNSKKFVIDKSKYTKNNVCMFDKFLDVIDKYEICMGFDNVKYIIKALKTYGLYTLLFRIVDKYTKYAPTLRTNDMFFVLKHDNPEMLEKTLLYKMFDSKKFQQTRKFLGYVLLYGKLNVAQYMISSLHMKCTLSKMNHLRYSLPRNVVTSDQKFDAKLVNFFVKNNIDDIQSIIKFVFKKSHNIHTIKYLVDTFGMSLKLCHIKKMLSCWNCTKSTLKYLFKSTILTPHTKFLLAKYILEKRHSPSTIAETKHEIFKKCIYGMTYDKLNEIALICCKESNLSMLMYVFDENNSMLTYHIIKQILMSDKFSMIGDDYMEIFKKIYNNTNIFKDILCNVSSDEKTKIINNIINSRQLNSNMLKFCKKINFYPTDKQLNIAISSVLNYIVLRNLDKNSFLTHSMLAIYINHKNISICPSSKLETLSVFDKNTHITLRLLHLCIKHFCYDNAMYLHSISNTKFTPHTYTLIVTNIRLAQEKPPFKRANYMTQYMTNSISICTKFIQYVYKTQKNITANNLQQINKFLLDQNVTIKYKFIMIDEYVPLEDELVNDNNFDIDENVDNDNNNLDLLDVAKEYDNISVNTDEIKSIECDSDSDSDSSDYSDDSNNSDTSENN